LLPNLVKLHVSYNCDRPDFGQEYIKRPHFKTRSNVSVLGNHLGTELSRPGARGSCTALGSAFLSSDHFPRLQSLYIAFDNHYYNHNIQRILTETNEGKFDVVAGRLSAVAPKLRDFHLGYYEDMSAGYFDYIAPVTTLLAFKSLSSLTLPQELLLSHNYGTESQDHTPAAITLLLPPSLERISFYFPTVGVLDWLEELLDHGRDHLPKLEVVTLDCSNVRGDIWPLMDAMSIVWASERDLWFGMTSTFQLGDEHLMN
jgi:hypothetical protein